MKKKFDFKLEGFLKLKKFNEQKLKIELGRINQEIFDVDKRIQQLHDEVSELYRSQEKIALEKNSGRMMAFFPFYIENKRADIRNQEVLRASLEKSYQLKLLELQEAMGETKVIDNFKEKKQNEHRKALEKKELEEIEEMNMIRARFQKESQL